MRCHADAQRSSAGNAAGAARVLAGVFTYNAVAVVVLVFAGAMSSMVGVLLWLAVGYHLVLAAWRERASSGEHIP